MSKGSWLSAQCVAIGSGHLQMCFPVLRGAFNVLGAEYGATLAVSVRHLSSLLISWRRETKTPDLKTRRCFHDPTNFVDWFSRVCHFCPAARSVEAGEAQKGWRARTGRRSDFAPLCFTAADKKKKKTTPARRPVMSYCITELKSEHERGLIFEFFPFVLISPRALL